MYREKSREALLEEQKILFSRYEEWKKKALSLDMTRGKPSPDQVNLSNEMHRILKEGDYFTRDQVDVRNYGGVEGIPEARELFGALLGLPPQQVLVEGNSSLQLMFSIVSMAFSRGLLGEEPWCRQGEVKFLCPVPGYDRHFAITEYFGIQMIPIAMGEDGPDMDQIAEFVETDPMVKGIWLVPKYQNPTGVIFSDQVVRAFASLSPAAPDFRLYWDNAYGVHDLYEEHSILNIVTECEKAHHPHLAYSFCSTSKITCPGDGVAAVGASKENIAQIKKEISIQTVGPDKVNQLRHVRFLKDIAHIREHMKRHASILAPKFEAVLSGLEKEFAKTGIAQWFSPKGGYFISVDLLPGTAKETVRLCREAGLSLTPAGATFPYGKDPSDSNLRLAPSYPSQVEVEKAIELFAICARLAAVELLLKERIPEPTIEER